jgi:uncharacterized protein YjbI with pentapeptide repeats
MQIKKIDPKKAARDIKSGMDDAALMRKYNLSIRGLMMMFDKLMAKNELAPEDIKDREPYPDKPLHIRNQFTGEILFSAPADTIKDLVESAVKAGSSLCESDLAGANLFELQAEGADFSEALMFRTNLRNSNLKGAVFFRAELAQSIASLASFQRADLSEANLTEADLSSADISNAIMVKTNLDNADLKHANLSGADLRQARFLGADLSGANLSQSDLTDAELEGANLTDAVMEGTTTGRTSDDHP